MEKSILIIGVKLPFTTFLRRKFYALGSSGRFNLIIGATGKVQKDQNTPYRIVRLPSTEDHLLKKLAYLLLYFLKMALFPRLCTKIVKISWKNSTGIKQFFNMLIKYLSIATLDFDIIHFEWISGTYYYLPLLELLKKPYTVSARGSELTIKPLLDTRNKERLKEILRRARAVHCVSKAMEAEVKKIYKKGNTMVIYNGIDLEIFKCNLQQKTFHSLNIIFIGNLNWRKSVDSALYIFYKYLERGGKGKMFIIGDGEEKEKMYSTINTLNIANSVNYLGRRNENEIAEILKDMDVLLLPTFAEGLANVILEAMATCTVPVVTAIHGNIEPITHGKNGFLFPLLDIEKTVEYLYSLYESPNLLKDMKKNARDKAEKDFNLKNMQMGHVEFYERLIL